MFSREVLEQLAEAVRLGRYAALQQLTAARALYEVYRRALAHPEAFVGREGATHTTSEDPASAVLAPLALEREIEKKELRNAVLLFEELPQTRALLATERVYWEAGEVICAIASTLPRDSRAVFDERAAALAVSMNSDELWVACRHLRTQLRADRAASPARS